MNFKEMHARAQSAPFPLAAPDEEEQTSSSGKNLRSAATIPQTVEKSASSDVSSLKKSFGTIASAAKDVIKEGPVGPQKLDEMVYHSRSMERGE